MKKITTTKIILFSTLIFCAILELVIIAAWVLWDRTDAAGLAGVVAAPAAVVIGFYEWKAKCENLSKYQSISPCITKGGVIDPTEYSNLEE